MENKIIEIEELRDVEHRIISYMTQSSQHIDKVSKQLNKEDFTFIVNKIIYQAIIIGKDIFIKHNSISDIERSIQTIANILDEHHNIKKLATLNILSSVTSQNIKKDIETILNYSFEKEVAKNKNLNVIDMIIEDKNGRTSFYFTNNRLVEVTTTNIFKLPIELCDNFTDTMGHISTLELDTDDTKASMSFYGSEENPDGIASMHIKKDLVSLKWFDDICKWADDYKLNEDIFPRDRFKLESLKKLDISDKNIKVLPKQINKLENLQELIMDNNQIEILPLEIFELKNLYILSFLHNKVSFIPKNISNLSNLIIFGACDNNIKKLPQNFYELKNLIIICLHGNNLTTLSNSISNFKRLISLTISNNDIKKLPSSISKLEFLESIDLENTQIDDITNILKLPQLTQISCDDKFLPLLLKNERILKDIDSINLSESKYQKDDEIFKSINLKQKTKKWIEEKDRRNNGCIVLSKCSIQSDILRIENKYKEDHNLDKYNEKSIKIAFDIVDDEPYTALKLFNTINETNSIACEQNKDSYQKHLGVTGVLPHEMLDLSVDIVCHIADYDLSKALELVDDIIEVDYFKVDALKCISAKLKDIRVDELIIQIENKIMEYDPEYTNKNVHSAGHFPIAKDEEL